MGGSRQMPSSVRCLRLECWRWPWRVSTLRDDPMGRQNSQLSLRRNEASHAPAAPAPGVAGLLMVAWLTPSAECWPFGAPFIGRRQPSGSIFKAMRLCEKGGSRCSARLAHLCSLLLRHSHVCRNSVQLLLAEKKRGGRNGSMRKSVQRLCPTFRCRRMYTAMRQGLKFRRVGGDWTIGKQYLGRPAAQI